MIAGRLVVIGLGLIGGSVAKGAKRRKIFNTVIGIALDAHTCEAACDLGVVDEAYVNWQSLAESLNSDDVVFIATPTLAIAQVLTQLKQWLHPSVTITDGASVKGSVLKDAERIYGTIPEQLVLGHPIAGSEKSGVTAANADLYQRQRVILTPTENTGVQHLKKVTDLWQQLGAEVLQLSVQEHDDILAATSHLPHALAFSLIDALAHDNKNENIFRYAAGGLRDFTRIASSDATMWRDIMLANRESVLSAIDLFSENLAQLRHAVDSSNGAQLHGIFSRAKAARDHFTEILSHQAAGLPSPNASRWIIAPGIKTRGEVFLPGNCPFTAHVLALAVLSRNLTHIRGLALTPQHQLFIDVLRCAGVNITLLNSQDNQQGAWGDISVEANEFSGINITAAQAVQLDELLGPLLITNLAAKSDSRWDLSLLDPNVLAQLGQLWLVLFTEQLPLNNNQLVITPRQPVGGVFDCHGDIVQALNLAVSAPVSLNNWVISGINCEVGLVVQAVHLSKQMGLLLNSLG
ncbi:MAG TPA: prephenate dehydrogenase/arogenate dehydrogenase family protein [Cellvibrionaceae bacterium]